MSQYRFTIGNHSYSFSDLKELMAKASPLKSGDVLAGCGASSEEERIAAKFALADLPLSVFLNETVIPYETDEITRLILDRKQIIRAGLEDHFCGKLLGLPMGCDICYTNHAEADQNDMDNLLTLLGVAGVNFIMFPFWTVSYPWHPSVT